MAASFTKPWSQKHKKLTKHGSLPYNLSNSFAQPLTNQELLDYTQARGDTALLEAYQTHSLDYTPNGGSRDLRRDIAKLYDDNVTEEHVLVFPGAQVALQTAAFAVVGMTSQTSNHDNNKKVHSIVFTPSYQSVQTSPLHAGSEITCLPLHPSTKWQINLQDVQNAIQPHTRYICINQPFNPAGTLMSHENQRALIDLAKQHDLIVLCDEVYRWLEHDPTDRLPAMCEVYDKGLSVVTTSKPWGACGVTIGWIICRHAALLQKLIQVQYFGTACPSRASEIQAMMVLRAHEFILQKNMEIIRYNKLLWVEFMERYAEFFSWVCPQAGAIAAICFLGPWSSEELGERLAQVGIGIKPAYCFLGEEDDVVAPEVDYFRVGYGEKSVPLAIEKLSEFVEEHKEEWRRQMGGDGGL